MDRDPLWVGSGRLEFPSFLLLWLVGLGITPIINRPHRPTDNAQVERCNGIWFEQVARGQRYATLQAVQRASDQARSNRLAALPSRNRHCAGRAPLVALPQLAHAPRPFHPDHEPQAFHMARIYHYLSTWLWHRSVDKTGQFSLGGRNHRIGSAYRGQVITLHFDPQSRLFIACHLDGHELLRFALATITPDYICGTGSPPLDTS